MDKKEIVLNNKVIQCECGKLVTGISKEHTESNLKVHRKSKEHKKNMELFNNNFK